MKRENLPGRERLNTPVDWSLASQLWGRMSDKSIAGKLGCSKQAVQQHREKNGIRRAFELVPAFLARRLNGAAHSGVTT